MLRSFFVSCAILLALALLEAAVLSNIFFLPIVPDLLLLAVTYFAIHNGRLLGVTTGFVAGLFLDFLSACPFGLNCLLRTLMGYIWGFLDKRLNMDSFFLQVFLGVMTTILKAGVLWLIAIFYPANVTGYKLFSFVLLGELIVNAVLCPVLFKILRVFDSVVVLNPESVN